MKQEWLLLVSTVTLTLALCLAIIRWFAPQLLGLPVDLQLVRTSKTLPPFYESVFRIADHESRDYLVNDPVTVVRARPKFPDMGGMGPNDILGFRNRSVPNSADVVVIGDSQTYGNNASLEENWPSLLAQHLNDKSPVVYNMATGGWGAVQYLDMFSKAMAFRPRLVVVAYYSGNDALDSFRAAYGIDRWERLRLDASLKASDAPSASFPPPESEHWSVEFADGVTTIFTPSIRLTANRRDDPVVRAGYGIMVRTAQTMSEIADKAGVELVFTVIPTKELVYAEKIRREGIDVPQPYVELIQAEEANIVSLAARLKDLPNVQYVDLVSHLQQAALLPSPLYLGNINGHPVAAGYDVIAHALEAVAREKLPNKPQGLIGVQMGSNRFQFLIVKDASVWRVPNPALAAANGWSLNAIPNVEFRDLAGLRWRGPISVVNPELHGPGPLVRNAAGIE